METRKIEMLLKVLEARVNYLESIIEEIIDRHDDLEKSHSDLHVFKKSLSDQHINIKKA